MVVDVEVVVAGTVVLVVVVVVVVDVVATDVVVDGAVDAGTVGSVPAAGVHAAATNVRRAVAPSSRRVDIRGSISQPAGIPGMGCGGSPGSGNVRGPRQRPEVEPCGPGGRRAVTGG